MTCMSLNVSSQVKRGGKGLRGAMPFMRPSKSNVQEQKKGGQLPGPGAAAGLAAQDVRESLVMAEPFCVLISVEVV